MSRNHIILKYYGRPTLCKLIYPMGYALLVCSFCFGLVSCGEDQYQIERKLSIAVDTQYRAVSKLLTPELDSLCKTRYKTDLPRMVDSIVSVRQKQIEEKIKQLKSNNQASR